MGEKEKKKNQPTDNGPNLSFKLSVVFFVLLTIGGAINVFLTQSAGSVKLRKEGRTSEKVNYRREDSSSEEEEEDDIWDILILVQQWPETFCKIKFNKPNKINCRYPRDRELWTIHGMWPTKRGTRGPNDCAINHYFDMSQLTSIKDDLNYYWPNLIASASNQNFWSYEWRKHGTCALDHEDLDSQLKYFQRALNIARSKNMKDVLSTKGIFPSAQTGVLLSEILNAISSWHSGRPDIQCHYDGSTGRHFLKEIRICFDRYNHDVDCDREGNCPHGKGIIYPPAESSN